MNSFIKTLLKTGIPFGIIMGVAFTFFSGIHGWSGIITGIISGILSGVFFGLAAATFVSIQEKKFTRNRPLLPDDKLIKEGGANHFLNGEAVGGWIYMTENKFIFKSHNSNIQNHELTIPIKEIDYVEKANTFGIIPNQLRLTLRDGQIEKFVVSGAKDWVKSIKEFI